MADLRENELLNLVLLEDLALDRLHCVLEYLKDNEALIESLHLEAAHAFYFGNLVGLEIFNSFIFIFLWVFVIWGACLQEEGELGELGEKGWFLLLENFLLFGEENHLVNVLFLVLIDTGHVVRIAHVVS